MGLFKQKQTQANENQNTTDLKTQANVLLKKPAQTMTKEDKKIISRRMAEIRKYSGDGNTVQNTIPYMCMYRDGVCQVSENFYSMTVQFFDTNYALADFEEQDNIFGKYCTLLNSFDNSIKFQLTFENQNRSKDKIIETVQIPEQDDDFFL